MSCRIAILFVSTYIFVWPANAKYCIKLPTCEELGYIYPHKDGRRSVRCPFDKEKVLYLDYCQAYGLIGKPDSIAGEYQECIEEKADGTKVNTGYYRYTRCNAGYVYKNGVCVQICNLSGTSKIENCKSQESCTTETGGVMYGSCNECFDGYELSSAGSCVRSCYGNASTPGNCAKFDTCILEDSSGTSTPYYKCVQCDTDYRLDTETYTCSNTCEYTSTTLPEGCKSTDSCRNDYGVRRYSTSCTGECQTGYEKNSSQQCTKTCMYTSTTSMTGCSNENSCEIYESGTIKTKYAGICPSGGCYSGYTEENGVCNQYCYRQYNTNHCTTMEKCKLGSSSGESEYSLCLTCDTGYFTYNGYCKSCTEQIYGRTGTLVGSSTPSCDSDKQVMKYKCDGEEYYYCSET